VIQRQSVPSRHIPVPGTFNLRDVGGYPTHEGLDVRWGALYRSDGLHNLGSAGLDAVARLGIGTVIDLRRDVEISRAPNPCASDPRFQYHNIPLRIGASGPAEHPRDLTALYLAYLEHGTASVRAVMSTIAAAPADQPVLVHCTAGKDRTGLIVALALGGAGVVPEAILDDYLLTGTLIAPLLPSIRAAAAREGQDPGALEPMLACERAFMQTALSYVDVRYGSPEAYLIAAGVTERELHQLRRRLLGA